ncbi:pre-rRNA-processing protein TSR4, partial [Phenoliferia sp. Uapishka_3]
MTPQAFVSQASAGEGFDLASLSDDEDAASTTTSAGSIWPSDSGTTVLGYIDGPITSSTILEDWKTSRVGGLPTFPPLSVEPTPASALCGACRMPMPMLTQIYCPLENSLFERVVYTFGCPAKSCRGKPGSVRAWRAGLRWVEEEGLVEEEASVLKGVEKQKTRLGDLVFGAQGLPGPAIAAAANFNPFSSSVSAVSTNPFAAATAFNPFAPAVANPSSTPTLPNPFELATKPVENTKPTDVPRRSNLDLLTSSFAKTTVSVAHPRPTSPAPSFRNRDSTWLAHPSYPAQYLTTAYEPAVPSSTLRQPVSMPAPYLPPADIAEKHREGKGSGGRVKKGAVVKPGKAPAAGGDGWAGEGYEVQKVRGVDDVFLRFQERVAREGLQCVRYGHASIPLPFSSLSPSYSLLFPSTSSSPLGSYDPSRVPRCRHCGSDSTFEYQLMPALVAILMKLDLSYPTKEVPGSKGKDQDTTIMEHDGVEFATVMIFACVCECVDSGGEESWREEQVSIELEAE